MDYLEPYFFMFLDTLWKSYNSTISRNRHLIITGHTIFFRGYNNKKMGTLQFHIPGFQNDPNYPKQKEFLKSYKENLK